MAPVLLTADEVAKKLRVKRRTVYDYVKRGMLKPTRIGRLMRFKEDDVRALAEPNPRG